MRLSNELSDGQSDYLMDREMNCLTDCLIN